MVSVPARFREFPRDRPLLALAIAIFAVELVGASGSIFTVQGLGTWYDTLQRPALAPPN
jgi:tryptophan-rich sensory protein